MTQADVALDTLASEGLQFQRDAIFIVQKDNAALLSVTGVSGPLDEEELEVGPELKRELVDGSLGVAIHMNYAWDQVMPLPPPARAYVQATLHDVFPEDEYLNVLLEHAWLVRYDAAGQRLRCIDRRSVAATLRPLADLRLPGSVPGNGLSRYLIYSDSTPEAALELRETGSFIGAWHLCSCGAPGDGSEYVWIDQDRLVAYAWIGDAVQSLALLPRPLSESMVGALRGK